MPTMNSPSPSIRRGFTLLEIMIATGIGVVVVGLIAQAYFGANKSQAIAVGTSMLKTAGQAAVDDIYKNLHQNRHLFDRRLAAGDTTDTFLNRLPIAPFNNQPGALTPGLPTPDPFVELRLPLVDEDGTFSAQPDASGVPTNAEFNADAVGNSLFFATLEPQATLRDQDDVLMDTIGRSTYLMPAARIHFYYLARRPLGNTAPVRPGSDYVYWIMHFKSKPYLDYHEVVKWMRLVKDDPDVANSDAEAFIASKFFALSSAYAGALDLTADDAANALYRLTPAGDFRDLEPAPATDKFALDDFRTPVKFAMVGQFGLPMVAFNTEAGTNGTPGVPVDKVRVPAYALPDAPYPFGFETMVIGPKAGRQVLVRLMLMARTAPGGHMVDQSFQQIIHIYEYH